MKKGDFLWGLVLALFVVLLVIPGTREVFISFTKVHPYMAGFLKFSILATMGELLGGRIVSGDWNNKPNGLIYRAIVWGFLGMLLVIVFEIYGSGVAAAQKKGLLPAGTGIIYAFLVSFLNNITFAPVLMGAHKIADTFIDLKYERSNEPITVSKIAKRIDWDCFLSFVIFKTIPFFWIPAHTITFMLPPEYKVIFAASLSIVLGCILAIAKKKSIKIA